MSDAANSPAAPPAFGSLEWGRRGRGSLSPGEMLDAARQALWVSLADLPSRLRAALLGGRAHDSALAKLQAPPDTPLAREAFEHARDCCPQELIAHCLRCWLLGDLLARRRAIAFDEEILYVACVLHDLGLTDAHRAAPWEPVGCFAIHGAEVAAPLLEGWGAHPEHCRQVGEAIALHMNPSVPEGLGAEAHLLHAAAHLDVAGTRAGALPAADLRAVLAEHPREGFAVFFAQQMRREASERPRSRAALMWKLGMGSAIDRNPLDHVR